MSVNRNHTIYDYLDLSDSKFYLLLVLARMYSKFCSSTTCAPDSSLTIKCSALAWFVIDLSDGNVLEHLEHFKIDVKSFVGGTMGFWGAVLLTGDISRRSPLLFSLTLVD